MIVCDRFVFLHLHKSGGTFVNQMLLKCEPSARRLGYHLPYTELPSEFRHLPVLGSVRNPWDYYVSWYHFQASQPRPNALFQVCSDSGSLTFGPTITRLLSLHEDPQRVAALVAAFPDQFVGHGLNLTKTCIASILGSGRGFYSFLYQRLYDQCPEPTLVKTENLRAGLRQFLEALSAQPSDLMNYFIENAPDLNTSQHRPYRDYYDAPLRDLVARNEASIIGAHTYSF